MKDCVYKLAAIGYNFAACGDHDAVGGRGMAAFVVELAMSAVAKVKAFAAMPPDIFQGEGSRRHRLRL